MFIARSQFCGSQTVDLPGRVEPVWPRDALRVLVVLGGGFW